ncbi:hypothetical protein DM860_008152 [Cuscuta australis]|uniref:Uncharacterized protein n=1 Tax=Cuscuta australis TaxID=267555 RepID=A0A328D2H9_9ASTE|nr:hypothetical protein DM860_008152 [Cuscuta australis]
MDAIAAEDHHHLLLHRIKGKSVIDQSKIYNEIPPDEELKLGEDGCDDEFDAAVEEDEDEEEEEEFSFVCAGDGGSPIAAEDVFVNGQIRPDYALFGGGYTLGGGDSSQSPPPVRNLFVQTSEASGSEAGGSSSGEAVEVAGPDGCKKSNSTGFSKFWRFRDLLNRSNSDGRDAFVFLKNPAPSAGKIAEKQSDFCSPPPPQTAKKTGEIEVNAGRTVTQKKKKKKKSNKELSAHECYMRSKQRDGERRRSYLPYRPELVGFFTNVKGGLTKNIHPF